MIHLLKVQLSPLSSAVPHWQAEARVFLADAARRLAPSMPQRIDLSGIYATAVSGLPDGFDGPFRKTVPDACPWTLGDLV